MVGPAQSQSYSYEPIQLNLGPMYRSNLASQNRSRLSPFAPNALTDVYNVFSSRRKPFRSSI